MVFLLAIAAYEKRLVFKLPALALAGYSTYCLMLTFSRGAYLGFLVGLVFLAVVKERKLLLLLIPFLLTWQVFVPPSVKERVSTTYDESSHELESSAAERVTIWQDAVELIPQYPLFGTGFATYAYMHRVSMYADTHNYYLKVLVETGLLGLLLFLALMTQMGRVGYKLFAGATSDPFLKSLGLGVMVALVSIFVSNMFGDRWTYIEEVGFFWAALGCAARGLLLLEEAAKPQEAAVPSAIEPDLLHPELIQIE